MLIAPIQLDFDLLGFILRRLGLSVINISRNTITIRGQRSHPIEFETALLQSVRCPVAIPRATIAPYYGISRITGISVTGRYCRWLVRLVLFCAADKADGKYG
jgi:hypothetical protein